VFIQYTKSEYTTDTDLLIEVHLEMPDEECWKRKDDDIKNDVCRATDNVHDWIVGGSDAYYPITPKRPDLKECGEEEGDEPGDYDRHHDLENFWEVAD
jgi:hypothetical protein